jgi:dTDP-4-amino-4,6-dideoxygalactose transaminase
VSVAGVRTPERPAAAGGTPLRSESEFLTFFRPSIGSEEEAAVVDTLRSGWLTSGPRTLAFESAFARFTGSRHAVSVASCTAGLHLLLRAHGVGPGDEVVVPAITFAATANAVLHAGAQPVLADVDPRGLGLDADALEAALGPRTRAVIAVHLYGWPCAMDRLRAVCAEHDLVLLEDAAHAVGARLGGRAVGTLGDGAAFSFYATKNMTTGEGGMITLERDDLVERLTRERLHGLDYDASRRDDAAYTHWEAVSPGWKYNLPEMAAALGLVQLARLPKFLEERRRLDARYREALAGVEAFEPVTGPAEAESAAHLFPIRLRPGTLRLDRDGVLDALLAENIGVGVHFRSLAEHRHFQETCGTPPEALPQAHAASRSLLSLPLYPDLDDADQDDVVAALLRIAHHYRT